MFIITSLFLLISDLCPHVSLTMATLLRRINVLLIVGGMLILLIEPDWTELLEMDWTTISQV